MNASNDKQSEATSSAEHLESIALDALVDPDGGLLQSVREQDKDDIQTALGKHPNIAAEWDAEPTGNGQPDVAINRTDGVPIDDYCDNQRLNIPARLQLFIPVCRAVHFAHQHAVIHGGLCPNNIVITANGVPNVMGFRVARAAHSEAGKEHDSGGTAMSARPAITASQRCVGLECKSPEQLSGELTTTASDIYALGMVLYRLLTGRSPYRLESGTRSDVLKAAFEQAPEKPSSAMSRREKPVTDLAITPLPASAELPEPGPDQPCEVDPRAILPPPIQTVEDIALARRCSPGRLKRTLTGELDAIVLMALRKEPERRYASADQFADDVGQYLEGMPVRAFSNSTVYRWRKSVQRHHVLVTFALVAVAALSAAVVGLTYRLTLVHRQRDRAERASAQAREIVDQFFTRVIADRLLIQPEFDPPRVALLKNVQRFYEEYLALHSSDETLHPDLIEASSRIAKIAGVIGSSADAVFQYRQAVTLWEQLLSEQPTNRHYQEKLAATLGDLGAVLTPMADQLDEADRTLRHASVLIEPLIAALPESVSLREELGWVLLNLARVRSRQGRPDEALESLERVVQVESELAAANPQFLKPRILLATAYTTAGRILGAQASDLHRAIAFYEEADKIYQTIVQEHPELADQAYQLAGNLNELSQLEQRLGELDPAFLHLCRSLSIFERLDQFSPEVLIYQKRIASVYNTMTDLQRKRAETADSLAFAQKARTLLERLVAEHPRDFDLRTDLAKTYSNIGRYSQETGKSDEALRSFQRTIDLYESLPDLDPQSAYNLACTISRCIPLIGTKNRSPDSGRAVPEPTKGDQLRRRLYGDRAIAALRRAVLKGHFTAEAVETEKDLDPLHERSDFKELINDLEKKPAAAGN
jgi:non-specific serine/threonine protein kinase/serine/threonine-protein kinase